MKIHPKDFTDRCIRMGIHHRGCGQSARDLLKRLRCAPIMAECKKAAVRAPRFPELGLLISAGLVRYEAGERKYVIAPAGETWLAELEIHGLIGEEVAA